MRVLLLLCAMLITDALAFEGRFRVEFWQEAKQAGNRASSHIDYQLRSMGLGRRG
jgi:hypothetical protein